VPNLSFGPDIVAGLRKYSALYFDVHLMIENPEKFALPFIKAGADCVTVHPEAKGDIDEALHICNENKVAFGMALKPNTDLTKFSNYYDECEILLIMSIEPGFGGQAFMPAALERISFAKRLRRERDLRYKISVDGGINPFTGALCAEAGADILVAGSAIFLSDDPAAQIQLLKGARTIE
jgi:ribulose-phosphate 3-epimerase